MKHLIFFLSSNLLFLSLDVKSQIYITGFVNDSFGNPIEYVTVMAQKDNTIIISAITDNQGHFSLRFNGPAVNYTLQFSHINYQTINTQSSVLKDTPLRIIMQPLNRNTLSNVTVSSKKPLFERKVDRLVYNVQNSIGAQTNTVWDQLLKVPGLRSDGSSNLLYLIQSVRVRINDKVQMLSGEDLAEYLRSLPASSVSKIELITNPSARYDADGGVVVNIVTLKKTKGVYGSIQAVYEQGIYGRARSGADLNIQREKFGIYARYSCSPGTGYTFGNQQLYYPEQGLSPTIWEQDYGKRSDYIRNGYLVSLDYFFNPKNTISIEMTGLNTINRSSYNADNLVTKQTNIDSIVNSTTKTKTPIDNYAININHIYKIDSLGRQLVFYGDFTNYNKNQYQDVTALTLAKDYSLLRKHGQININTLQHVQLGSFSTDYSGPLCKKHHFEAGLKYSYSQIDNNLIQISNNTNIDTSKSNRFIYTEQNYAVYASADGKLLNVEYKVGLRLEYTNALGESTTVGISNRNKYLRFFPALSLGKKIADNHYINFAYNRRISRPEYFRLNPFKVYATPYEVYVGNPFLLPSFTSRFEAGYTYKDNYYISFYYTRVDNSFQQTTYQDPLSSTLTYTHVNFGKKREFGFYGGFSKNFGKKLESNFYFQGSQQIHQTLFLTAPLTNKNFRYTASIDNTFTISTKNNIAASLNAWYTSRTVQGIFVFGDTWHVEVAVRKQFKPRWFLSLALNDIFFSQANWATVNHLDQYMRFIEWNDTRQVKLSVSYNYGKRVNAKAVKRKLSGEAEKQRI